MHASDLHLTVGLSPVVRVDGNLGRIGDGADLTASDVEIMVRSTVDEAGWQALVAGRSYDYAMTPADGRRWRVNAYFHRGGLGAVFRSIPSRGADPRADRRPAGARTVRGGTMGTCPLGGADGLGQDRDPGGDDRPGSTTAGRAHLDP